MTQKHIGSIVYAFVWVCLLSWQVAAASVIQLDFWTPFGGGDAPTKALNALVDEFNRTHTDIQVNHRPLTGDMAQQYKVAVAGGTMPDIGWEAEDWFMDLLNEDIIVPMDTLAQRNKFDTTQFWPGVWGPKYQGRQWGFPFEIGSEAMIYNQDTFNNAGIGKAPATWDEFLAVAKKVTDPEKGTFGLHPLWPAYITVQWMWRNGGDLISPDLKKASFTDARNVEALQWWGDLEAKHHVVGASFESGKAAMIVVHSGWYANVTNLPFTSGTALAPVPQNGHRASLSYYKEIVVFNKKNPAREAAAWTFIKWLMDPERQANWCIATGYLPVSQNVLRTDAYRAYLQRTPGIMPWVDELSYIRHFPFTPAYGQLLGLLDQAVNQVRQGMPAYTALAGLQEQAQAIIDAVNERAK